MVRNANSTDINSYNSTVQGRAAAGHTAIRGFSSMWRAVASTPSVDARDNTSTTYTSSNKGLEIHWLRGNRVANNYEDFYDNSWDNRSIRTESGGGLPNNGENDLPNGGRYVWTGSNANGTGYDGRELGAGDNTFSLECA